MTDRYGITVVGLGYVGMSLAVLLAGHYRVTALDIDGERVALVNANQPTAADAIMTEHMANAERSLAATTSPAETYADARFVIVATPTDYEPDKNYFDTSSVEAVFNQAREHNATVTVGIKSTILVGFTEPEKVFKSNLHGTASVVADCQKNGCKLVCARSSTKFGDRSLGRKQSPYGW